MAVRIYLEESARRFETGVRELEVLGGFKLAGDEETYRLIEAMLRRCRACYRTKKIHLGMDEAMKKLKPKNVLVYGGDIGYDFKGANVKYYDNHVTEKMKNLKNI